MASPYPATLLINRAYYLSGIVSRELQTVSGSQLNDGLFLLNGLLEFKGTDTSLIPYFQRTEFSLVYGQEMYYLENVYQIETITFNMGVVRYPMTSTSRSQYFGQGRVDNISSLPFQWHLERTKGGSNLYVYFLPDAPYLAKISAKYGLTDVSASTDLSTVYDYFYIEYLRYGLAKYICHEFGVTFNEDKEYLLKTMEKKLKWVSPPDLTMTKSNLITNSRNSINWPQVNIGKGFYPP